MSWINKARKSILGEKHDLKSLEGYWIVPRKMSIEGLEELTIQKTKLSEDMKNIPKGSLKALYKTAFKYGVADHNFDNENGEKAKWDDALFEKLLEYPDVSQEIFDCVTEMNAPLAQESSEKSMT